MALKPLLNARINQYTKLYLYENENHLHLLAEYVRLESSQILINLVRINEEMIPCLNKQD